MLEVKQYKLSVKRILHFMSQMTLESGTSPITFTVYVRYGSMLNHFYSYSIFSYSTVFSS
jgi:hypothetical protein